MNLLSFSLSDISAFDIIVVLIGILIAIYIAVKITKTVIKIIAYSLIVIALVGAMYYWHSGNIDLRSDKFMMEALKNKYCNNPDDSVKCNCIVMPIYEDIKSQYDEKELQSVAKNKVKTIRVVLQSAARQKESIQSCLRDNNALDQWDSFLREVKELELSQGNE